MPENKMTLHQKLIEIRKECSYLKKGNQGYQFKYVSSSQTIGALRNKMDELRILLIPEVTGHSVGEKETKKGDKEFFTELDIKYTWVNVDNPSETITMLWYGQGVDSGEKGVGKALTYAEKYFLLKFFQIATDKDDPDSNQGGKSGGQQGGGKSTEQQQKVTPMVDKEQVKDIAKLFEGYGVEKGKMVDTISLILGHQVHTSSELSKDDADKIIAILKDSERAKAYLPQSGGDGYQDEIPF